MLKLLFAMVLMIPVSLLNMWWIVQLWLFFFVLFLFWGVVLIFFMLI